MKHFRKDDISSPISFFCRGARKTKLKIMFCIALSLMLSMSPCASAKAWDFPHIESNITFTTPNYWVDTWNNANISGDILGHSSSDPDYDVIIKQEQYNSSPANTLTYNACKSINVTNTTGTLTKDKSYRVSIKFTPSISFKQSLSGIIGSANATYYVLIGGKRYDFGNSPFLYFDVTGVSTDYFLIGAEINTTFAGISDAHGYCYSVLTFSEVSYNIVETTSYPDQGTAILDTTLKQNQILLDSINTLSSKTYTELQTHTGWLNNIYLQSTYTNAKLDIANSHLNNIKTLTNTQNGLITKTNDLLENLTGGYDASDGNGSVSDFDGTINDFEDAQSNITDSANDYVNDYTISSDGAFASSGLAPAVSLASSMMQSIFVSSGEFGVVISIGFGLTLVTMLIGLSKFFTR